MKSDRKHHKVTRKKALFVLTQESQADVAQIVIRMKERFQDLDEHFDVRELVTTTLAAADKIETSFLNASQEYEFLFKLAGLLKASVPKSNRSDQLVGSKLAPFALLFVEVLRANGKLRPGHKRIDWSDDDAIMLEFERMWEKRKFAEGIELLQSAADFAADNPLQVSENRYVALVVNTAYFLQSVQGDEPIFLPVSTKLASLFGTTEVTLGTAVSRAVRENYLVLVAEAQGQARARRFKFNFEHPGIKVRPTVELPEPALAEPKQQSESATVSRSS